MPRGLFGLSLGLSAYFSQWTAKWSVAYISVISGGIIIRKPRPSNSIGGLVVRRDPTDTSVGN